MDWDHLRFFAALVQAGSLAGAARLLQVEHTTVARRLRALGTLLLHLSRSETDIVISLERPKRGLVVATKLTDYHTSLYGEHQNRAPHSGRVALFKRRSARAARGIGEVRFCKAGVTKVWMMGKCFVWNFLGVPNFFSEGGREIFL